MRIRVLNKKRIGKLLVVEFSDHTENVNKAALTRVPGFLQSYDNKNIVLEVWQTPDMPGDVAGTTRFCIVRSTIQRMFLIPDELWSGGKK